MAYEKKKNVLNISFCKIVRSLRNKIVLAENFNVAITLISTSLVNNLAN